MVTKFLQAASRGDQQEMTKYASNVVVRSWTERLKKWQISDTCLGTQSGTCAFSYVSPEGGGFTWEATLIRNGDILSIANIEALGGGA